MKERSGGKIVDKTEEGYGINDWNATRNRKRHIPMDAMDITPWLYTDAVPTDTVE